MKPRIGIYGSVPKNSEVFQTITTILGYDPFRVKETIQDSVVAPFCGRAKKFGAHFTIYDIFTPTDKDLLIERVKNLVKEIKPFDFSFAGIGGYVRGDYQRKSIYKSNLKTVIALDFDEVSIKKFSTIHETIITNIQDLRANIEPEFDKDIFRNIPELWSMVEKYGAPYVLENYAPHLTIASGLDGSEETLSKLMDHVSETYGRKLLNIQIPFDRIYIFEEILGGHFDGYFKVIEEIKLDH